MIRSLSPSVRRAAPWLLGLGIVALLVTRVPREALGAALSRGHYLALFFTTLGVSTVVLVTDTFSTNLSLTTTGVRWPFLRTLAIRGATYALALVSYAVGQVGVGYYLHRAGITAARAVGIMLFQTGTTFAALWLVTTAAWGLAGRFDALWWTLVAGTGALGIYLVIVARAPEVLARRKALAPLFDAGVRGHWVAILGRAPHVLMLILGIWLAMLAWGISVPFAVAMTTMPAVVIVTVLPISPGGLGTSQAAMVVLFSQFAPGSGAEQREASILAFGVVYFVSGMVAQVTIGFVCRGLLAWLERRSAPASVAASEAPTA